MFPTLSQDIAPLRTLGFQPGERNIFLHILTVCNLSCRHCYINTDMHGGGMVDADRLKDWLRIFFDPAKENNCIFLGGEPTLHPHLPQAISWAQDTGYSSITVDSNGFLFHDFFERVDSGALDCLSFSLDGPDKATNDPLRGEGVFDVCSVSIQKAVRLGFATAVIYTVNAANIHALPRVPELLARWGVRRLFIQVVGLRGKNFTGGKEPVRQVESTLWRDVVPAVAFKAAALGLEVVYPPVYLDKEEIFQCAGRVADNFFVFPSGRVYRCPLCEDYPVNAFRIEAGSLQAITGLTEERFFSLDIPEGCVMNRLLQPGTIEYDENGRPQWRIACCLLKRQWAPVDG